MKRVSVSAFFLSVLSGCVSVPDGLEPVKPFDADRFLGTWYEVARLDHFFERGLDQVTANYSPRDGGGITVTNRGYSAKKGKFKQANGIAHLAGEPNEGFLKVSFFRPFYAPYVVFGLDEDYQQAWISSSDSSLWLLSRTRTISDADKQRFIDAVTEKGYDASSLIWVNQTPESN